MSSLLLTALATGSSGQRAPYVDDVFSTYLYTGNGSTQTINNGIDLAGEGGLVWIKNRTIGHSHGLFDTVRGATKRLISDTSDAASTNSNALTSFASNGFSVGLEVQFNGNGSQYASWTFRCSERFFDVVTYTGNGVAGRQIAHSLGQEVGMAVIKSTNNSGTGYDGWYVRHRSATGLLYLNLTNAQETSFGPHIPAVSTTTFTVGADCNENNETYIAYLFAHDPSAEGIIQCGSYVGNGSSNGPIVNLGWEPQYLLIKRATGGSSEWSIIDSMRGFTMADDPTLAANNSNAENGTSSLSNKVDPLATGFQIKDTGGSFNQDAHAYIFLAIRCPNKTPTSGTQVYNAITYTGNGSSQAISTPLNNFSLIISKALNSGPGASSTQLTDQLRGFSRYLLSDNTNTEYNAAGAIDVGSSKITYATGYGAYVNQNAVNYINHFFRRAPGFMDVVCDTGTGVAHAIAHNLTKAPELIIRKSRSAATQWEVWHSALAATEKLVLNGNAAKVTDATAWNSTLPTATQITVGTGASVNANTATFVTYLFATLDGISKVGSYTGNGSTLNIDAGFGVNGPAFILIKRTDSTGDWYLWDSARGIVSGNDPHLSLNTTAAEVTTDDSVDPTAGGFAVNQNTATNINVSGGQYIYLAIAGGVYVPSGEAVFTTPGTYNWTVPTGVTSVCVVCVGGGGGGGDLGIVGGTSSFSSVLSVTGGKNSGATGIYSGGSPTGQDGGGNGGYSYQGVGGGGAGGYSGNGGGGGNNTSLNGVNGTGGGGGGGATYGNGYGGTGGGGVGLYGQGTNGLGSIYVTNASPGGGGGSGGSAGGNAIASAASNGGSYGGGGGAYGSYGGGGGGLGYKNNIAVIPGSLISVSVGSGGSNGGSSSGGNGGSGAVRIIWGYGRSFPYNAA